MAHFEDNRKVDRILTLQEYRNFICNPNKYASLIVASCQPNKSIVDALKMCSLHPQFQAIGRTGKKGELAEILVTAQQGKQKVLAVLDCSAGTDLPLLQALIAGKALYPNELRVVVACGHVPTTNEQKLFGELRPTSLLTPADGDWKKAICRVASDLLREFETSSSFRRDRSRLARPSWRTDVIESVRRRHELGNCVLSEEAWQRIQNLVTRFDEFPGIENANTSLVVRILQLVRPARVGLYTCKSGWDVCQSAYAGDPINNSYFAALASILREKGAFSEFASRSGININLSVRDAVSELELGYGDLAKLTPQYSLAASVTDSETDELSAVAVVFWPVSHGSKNIESLKAEISAYLYAYQEQSKKIGFLDEHMNDLIGEPRKEA